jgi:hypothetical protein
VCVVEEEEGLPILRRGACSGEGHVVIWNIVVTVRFTADFRFAIGSFDSNNFTSAAIIDCITNLYNITTIDILMI